MEENQLRSLADRQNIPLGTLEKDYALTNLLLVISNFRKLNSMVFKGGTALKKIYFENFRFSEDLDFTCLEDISQEFINFLKKEMSNLDVKFTGISELEKKNESTKFKVNYTMFNGRLGSVKVDLSLRGDVVMDHPEKLVLHFYDTFSNEFKVPAMALEEIMAEKIRAIIYTKHPRHLHDIWYLNEQNVKINLDMVRKKIKSAYNDDFDINLLKDRLPEKKKEWINDLKPLLPHDPPPFEVVSKKVLAIVSEAMK
ncbi:MAG: nucleotidyl transferase AbiEii/AbiGii toxin family protein [Nitrosopumilaceae archaeon]